MAGHLRKGELENVRFFGGAMDGQVLERHDVRVTYYYWYRVGSAVREGKATKDLYEWDSGRHGMVYRGTIFGWEDRRTMRRLSTAECTKAYQAIQRRKTAARR